MLPKGFVMNESQFKFIGYRISKIECLIEDDFGIENESISHQIDIENNFDVSDPRLVEVVLNIQVKSESNKFRFYLKIKGGFKADGEMSEEIFKLLAQQNAPAILFPYARAIITNYTAQANISPVILPAVNFMVKKDNS